MSDETHPERPRRRSSSAEAAATRWRQSHPDDDLDHEAPAVPEGDDGPGGHSASAAAAALRWREEHSGEENN